jgi:hypothetical protein
MSRDSHQFLETHDPAISLKVRTPSRRRVQSKPSQEEHGLRRLKAAVKALGSRAIDGRTTLGKALGQWRNELIADLGGPEAVSVQEHAVLDLAVKTKLLLDSIDAWLLVQPSLVDKRRRSVLPVVLQRQTLADALARYMAQLGLKRRRETKTITPQDLQAQAIAEIKRRAAQAAEERASDQGCEQCRQEPTIPPEAKQEWHGFGHPKPGRTSS